MATTLRYLLITAVRDRLFVSMLLALVGISLVAAFVGATSVAEDAAASITFASFAARLLVVLGVVLFVALHVRRLVESREMHLILSKPISRAGFVFAYWTSFSILAVLLSAAAGAAVAFAAWPPPSISGTIVWTVSLALEATVMTAFTLFVALSLSSMIGAALACFGFYALTRMVGLLLAIVHSDLRRAGDFNASVDRVVEVLGLLVPRLDLFALSRWPVYGLEDLATLGFLFAQAAVYTALLIAAAIFDFRGRRF